MTKTKRFATMVLAVAMMLSVGAISASAATSEDEGTAVVMPRNTTDRKTTFYWGSQGAISSSSWEQKDNYASRIYVKTFNGYYGGRDWALPYQGYDIRTYIGCEDIECPTKPSSVTSSWYHLNDYRSYAINGRMNYHSDLSARIQTRYINSTYSSGDVCTVWSPDYSPDGSTLLG